MSAVLTGYRMDAALQRAADLVAQDLSPARREAFSAGAAWFAQVFAEAGIQGSVGGNVREIVQRLQSAEHSAKQTLTRLESVSFDPGDLDPRGRQVLALTGSLLRSFGEALRPSPNGLPRLSDERNRTGVEQQIARAVSYIVWAYLTNGAALPVTDTEAPSEVAS